MEKVACESGTSFDPAVVDALKRRYREVEAKAQAQNKGSGPKLSTGIRIKRGSAPAAGFEAGSVRPPQDHSARSQGEDGSLGRLADTLSLRPSNTAELSREETLAILPGRVGQMGPHDGPAIF